MSAAHAAAQDVDSRSRFWLGLGVASGGSAEGTMGGLVGAVVLQKDSHYASIRALGLSDLGGASGPTTALDLLYGRAHMVSFGHAAVATGLSIASYEFCGDTLLDPCSSIALPILAEVAINARVIGVGVQAYGNFSPKSSFGVLVFFLQLGWLP